MRGVGRFGLVLAAVVVWGGLGEVCGYLETDGTKIVDAMTREEVQLACVNWYGQDQLDYVMGGLQFTTPASIASSIAQSGFNCVRVPISVELVLSNPLIASHAVTAYPPLQGKRGLDGLDAMVGALGDAGLMVILDMHMLDSNWCCNEDDENGLWWNDRWSVQQYHWALGNATQRYRSATHVVGFDLKNELRAATVGGRQIKPVWGGGGEADWAAAAEEAAEVVLGANGKLLVIVEGLNYATDLSGVASRPIQVSVANRLVYESHDYVFSSSYTQSYAAFEAQMDRQWGYIAKNATQAFAAPVWVGEFGSCNTDDNRCVTGNVGLALYLQHLTTYIRTGPFSFGYWAMDGTQSTGKGRTFGAPETYGVLNTTWDGIASPKLLQTILSAKH